MTTLTGVLVDAKRVTIRISGESWEHLVALTEEDGITMSDRIGALVTMWHNDPAIQEQLAPIARETAAESRRRRYGRLNT